MSYPTSSVTTSFRQVSELSTTAAEKMRALQWMAFGLCTWLSIFFISMNWQSKMGMQFAAYTKEIAALFGAYVIYAWPRENYVSKKLLAAFGGAVAVGLLWGINDPFYWDGIHTVGRSHMLYEGDFDGMRRLSLTYAALGFLLRYVANTNWMGHLYIIGCAAALIYALSRSVRHPGLRMLAVLMGLATPFIFVLSKWVYLDVPVMAGAMVCLLVLNWAAGNPTWKRFGIVFICLAVTCLLKEAGALVFIPMLALPILAPKSQRLRILAYVAGCIVLSSLLTYFVCSFHMQAHSDKDEANWLLLNPQYGSAKVTVGWFIRSVSVSMKSIIWWGFFFFAMVGFAKPRSRFGYAAIAAILLCQFIAMISISQFEMSRSWTSTPLMEPSQGKALAILTALAGVFLVSGYFSGSLSWRRPNRLEWLCLIFAAGVIFFFAAAGKVNTRKSGDMMIALDWRYIGICVPMLVVIAARSVGRLMERKNPAWFRGLAAGVLSLTLLVNYVRSADLAIFSGERAREIGKAYQVARDQPIRIAYAHWPLYHATGRYDYGSLKWKSDGFAIYPLTELGKLRKSQKQKNQMNPAILMHNGEFQSQIPSRKWCKDKLHDIKAEAYYLQPIGHDLKKNSFGSTYIAKVKF